MASQKNQRPVGVPAALAWGMEGTTLEDQSASGLSVAAGRSTALTSRRTTHRSNIVTIIGGSDRYFKDPTSSQRG
jgi:hypothetical protein